MEGVVFLVIISLVVRSLYRNSKEAQRKAAERRQERGEEPVSPTVEKQRTRPMPRLPGSLPEWIEMLEGKMPVEREAQPAPAIPAQPIEPQAYAPPMSSMPQGVSTEGCRTLPQDCESPHHTTRVERRQDAWKPQAEQSSPLSFLEGMPEIVKGVVYAEILARPQQRRRLRP